MTEKKKLNPLLIIVPIIAIVAAIVGIEMFSGKAADKGVEKPTTISVQQAETALRQINQNITVQSVSKTPIDGIWEMIVLTPQGKKIAYIDVEGKYILGGSLIELATGTDLTRARAEDMNKVDFASIPVNDAIVLGNPNAAKKVIVFDDPD